MGRGQSLNSVETSPPPPVCKPYISVFSALLQVVHIVFVFSALLQVVHIVYTIWYQCRIDIFFIDWEKPRGLLQPTNHRPAAPQTTPPPSVTPVSVWRTLFVVNEWNEIQSQRKINHFVLTMFVLLFAQVSVCMLHVEIVTRPPLPC